jgi:hypothetical protein
MQLEKSYLSLRPKRWIECARCLSETVRGDIYLLSGSLYLSTPRTWTQAPLWHGRVQSGHSFPQQQGDCGVLPAGGFNLGYMPRRFRKRLDKPLSARCSQQNLLAISTEYCITSITSAPQHRISWPPMRRAHPTRTITDSFTCTG